MTDVPRPPLAELVDRACRVQGVDNISQLVVVAKRQGLHLTLSTLSRISQIDYIGRPQDVTLDTLAHLARTHRRLVYAAAGRPIRERGPEPIPGWHDLTGDQQNRIRNLARVLLATLEPDDGRVTEPRSLEELIGIMALQATEPGSTAARGTALRLAILVRQARELWGGSAPGDPDDE